MESIYSLELQIMATGEAIGGVLFFYASGYLLKFRDEQFKGEWILNMNSENKFK